MSVRALAYVLVMATCCAFGRSDAMDWQAGISRCIITPENDVWLAGYGTKRAAEGTIHDLWAKVLALQAPDGKRAVMVTTDHMGMSRTVYDAIFGAVHERYGLAADEFMITFSHNHCGPCLTDDLVDYYPADDAQRAEVAAYTDWMVARVVDAVGEALDDLQPAELSMGMGTCSFAVNRRENTEEQVVQSRAQGLPLRGVVDHDVPVLAVRGEGGELRAALLGYACHPTTLSFTHWCGDYPGFAQIGIEAEHPGATAMFFNACGADQNPIPRRELALCEQYGAMLADAVNEVLAGEMQPVSAGLATAFEWIELAYEEVATRETLAPVAAGDESDLHVRWARRMLALLDEGAVFATGYEYPVQAWRLGDELLLIGMGGEAVVDYSLRFKREFGPGTWVCGYANDMAAYMPSRRVWEEGGYEGGPHLDEYGRPAWRWAGDVEDRIAAAVGRVVKRVSAA